MKLDHIYFALPTTEFEKKCFKYPSSIYSNRKRVKTPDEEWEGLYLRCRDQTYLEILNERRGNKLGIGFRSETPMEKGPPAEVKSLSHLLWQQLKTKVQSPILSRSPFKVIDRILVEAPHCLRENFKSCSNFFPAFLRETDQTSELDFGESKLSIKWGYPQSYPLELVSYGFTS